jgi:hypothetical protein
MRYRILRLMSLPTFTSLVISLIGCLTPRPHISPPQGMYDCPKTVTITDPERHATIFYTMDGTTPTTSSTKYTAPFVINDAGNVQAIAMSPRAKTSEVARVDYACATTTNLTRADFADSIQKHFSLPQPSHPIVFADVHPNDVIYSAAEAIWPFLQRQILCPGCMLSANFGSNNQITRAEAAIVLVNILIANHRIQISTDSDT